MSILKTFTGCAAACGLLLAAATPAAAASSLQIVFDVTPDNGDPVFQQTWTLDHGGHFTFLPGADFELYGPGTATATPYTAALYAATHLVDLDYSTYDLGRYVDPGDPASSEVSLDLYQSDEQDFALADDTYYAIGFYSLELRARAYGPPSPPAAYPTLADVSAFAQSGQVFDFEEKGLVQRFFSANSLYDSQLYRVDIRGQARVVSTTTIGSDAPEPAAWALMLAGFGGLGALLRRRRAGVLAG